MSNEGKVTNLTFSLRSGKDHENKLCTKAEFDFKGNISVEEATTLVSNFRDVVTEFEENANDAPMSSNSSESSESNGNSEHNGDELPDLIEEDDETEEEKEEENPSVMRYPVRGNAMSLNNLRYNGDTIKNAWRTFSSIMVESSQPRHMYGHRLTHYRIVFPPAGFTFNQLSLINSTGNVPDIFQGHGYPVCSCPSYNYKSYKITINGIRVPGLCKHIDEALASANIDATAINWLNRPDDLAYRFKNDLNEYQWVPQPSQAPVQHR